MATPPGSDAAASTDALTLAQLRDELRSFAAERDWNQFHTPRNLCLALTGEVGELAECFQWRADGECAPGLPAWTAADKEHLGEELADCLLYLVRLADRSGVDLADAALRKLAKNRAKYPADKSYGSAAKYTAYVEQPPGGAEQ
jgi:dCTP diphosphatase